MGSKKKLEQFLKEALRRAEEKYKIQKTKKRELRFAQKHTSVHFDQEARRKVLAYYGPYYPVDPVFHEFYTEKTGVFDERYIPNDCYYSYINSFYNNVGAARVLDNKCFYTRMFGERCKYPRTLAYRMNHFWYDENLSQLSEADLMRIVGEEKEIVVKKASESAGGHGVSFLCGGDIAAQFEKTCREIAGDIVVQYPFRQHEELSRLHAESVNTVRVMSLLRKDGEVKICSVVVRIGIGDSRVDNAGSGGIICGVQEDCRLKDRAFKPQGDVFYTHPTNGVHFSDHTVPSFEAIKKLVRELHPLVPHFRLVSWDISVDEAGDPVLIETNLNYGELEFHQLCNGPVFGEDTKQILDEVFQK